MIVDEWEKECPLLIAQRVIFGKWKLSILWFLSEHGTMRFGELLKVFDDSALTQKMLTQHLRELESDYLVSRKVYNEVPPKVEYSLTELGLSFMPVLKQMEEWGIHYMNHEVPTNNN